MKHGPMRNRLWQMLPSSGMWHKSEYFSIQKKSPGEAEESGSLLGTLQKAVKGAFEKQELLQLHQKKMESAYEMSEYVSNMMKDYFTTDNLMKVVKSKVHTFSKVTFLAFLAKYVFNFDKSLLFDIFEFFAPNLEKILDYLILKSIKKFEFSRQKSRF